MFNQGSLFWLFSLVLIHRFAAKHTPLILNNYNHGNHPRICHCGRWHSTRPSSHQSLSSPSSTDFICTTLLPSSLKVLDISLLYWSASIFRSMDLRRRNNSAGVHWRQLLLPWLPVSQHRNGWHTSRQPLTNQLDSTVSWPPPQLSR